MNMKFVSPWAKKVMSDWIFFSSMIHPWGFYLLVEMMKVEKEGKEGK
jgi:hypothetical protein